MSISQRLKRIIEYKNLNIKEFDELSGIPYRSVQNYLRHEREPKNAVLMKLHSRSDINLNWVVSSKGEMFSSEIGTPNLTPKKQFLINHYQTISKNTQIAFDNLFKTLSENS